MLFNKSTAIIGLSSLYLFALGLLGRPQTSVAQDTNQSAHSVDEIVDHAGRDFFNKMPQAVGMSIGIIKDGKSYTYNYGTTEKGGGKTPSADSLYPIASISKTFTGMLLAQAAGEKKLNLDDDIRKYLDSPYPNLEYQSHYIRVQQLVNHLSGLPFNLPDIPENRPPFSTPVSASIEDMLSRYSRAEFLADLHHVKLDRVPGQKFSYSNSAAILASIMLERIYGQPYENTLAQKIAKPLGMVDTTISLDKSQKDRLVKGYGDKGGLAPYPRDMMLGAGALKSTAADMLKYMQWQMTEADEAVKLSHKPTFTYNNYSVGLNWQIIKAGDRRRVWQEGDLPGFTSVCMFFPELKIGIVVFANEEDPVSSHALTLMINDIAKALDSRAAPLL